MATVKSKSSILLGLVAFTPERRVSPSVCTIVGYARKSIFSSISFLIR